MCSEGKHAHTKERKRERDSEGENERAREQYRGLFIYVSLLYSSS